MREPCNSRKLMPNHVCRPIFLYPPIDGAIKGVSSGYHKIGSGIVVGFSTKYQRGNLSEGEQNPLCKAIHQATLPRGCKVLLHYMHIAIGNAAGQLERRKSVCNLRIEDRKSGELAVKWELFLCLRRRNDSSRVHFRPRSRDR